MASITRHSRSGEGDAVGFDVNERSEQYTLTVDSVADDPIAKFRALLPPESRHPFDRTLFLKTHSVIERVSPLVWSMSASYAQAADATLGGLGVWLITVQFNTGTETLYQEIPDESGSSPRQLIGPLKYVTVENQQGATHKTESGIFLKAQVGAVDVRGLTRVSGDTSIILRSTTNVMNAWTIKAIADYKRGVNQDDFIDGAFYPGTLLFTSFSINERVGKIAGTKTEQYLYDIQLEFSYEPGGHTPETRTDTYRDDDHYEHLVRRLDGQEEQRSFRKYPSYVFNDMLQLFQIRTGIIRT